jgi:hypothetical protein
MAGTERASPAIEVYKGKSSDSIVMNAPNALNRQRSEHEKANPGGPQ